MQKYYSWDLINPRGWKKYEIKEIPFLKKRINIKTKRGVSIPIQMQFSSDIETYHQKQSNVKSEGCEFKTLNRKPFVMKHGLTIEQKRDKLKPFHKLDWVYLEKRLLYVVLLFDYTSVRFPINTMSSLSSISKPAGLAKNSHSFSISIRIRFDSRGKYL